MSCCSRWSRHWSSKRMALGIGSESMCTCWRQPWFRQRASLPYFNLDFIIIPLSIISILFSACYRSTHTQYLGDLVRGRVARQSSPPWDSSWPEYDRHDDFASFLNTKIDHFKLREVLAPLEDEVVTGETQEQTKDLRLFLPLFPNFKRPSFCKCDLRSDISETHLWRVARTIG
jgi:hypothetical protein